MFTTTSATTYADGNAMQLGDLVLNLGRYEFVVVAFHSATGDPLLREVSGGRVRNTGILGAADKTTLVRRNAAIVNFEKRTARFPK